MNTRGLMELVVLGIGYEMKILPPAIYAVLVLMTVITTVMTMPMVHLINWIKELIGHREERLDTNNKQLGLKVLLSFGRPITGATLLRLTNQLLSRGDVQLNVTALHITTDEDINSIDADKYFEDNFRPILTEADKLALPLETDHQVSRDVEGTILTKLVEEKYTLLIVGAGIRLSSDEDDREAMSMREQMSRRMGSFSVRTTEALLSIHGMLRDKMTFFIKKAPCSVGILLSRAFDTPKNIILFLACEDDIRMIPYARTITGNNRGELQIIAAPGLDTKKAILHKGEKILSGSFTELPEGCDLVILSYELWSDTFDHNKDLLLTLPSTLILNLK